MASLASSRAGNRPAERQGMRTDFPACDPLGPFAFHFRSTTVRPALDMHDPQEPENPSSPCLDAGVEREAPASAAAEAAVTGAARADGRWSEVQAVLQGLIQREQFETWFRRADLRRLDETRVCLAVQNGFTRDWLVKHYLAS